MNQKVTRTNSNTKENHSKFGRNIG